MEVRLLGHVEVVIDGQAKPVGRRRDRALLAMLAFAIGKPVATTDLIDALWDGEPPSTARKTIQVHASRLRQRIAQWGDPDRLRLVGRGSGYAIEGDPDVVDAHRFLRGVQAARHTVQPAERSRLLTEALELWHGPPVADLPFAGIRNRICARLEEVRLTALELHVTTELDLGRHDVLVGELADLTTRYPTHEGFTAAHMLALHRAGRHAEALEVFQQARAVLAEELGIDVGRRLGELHTAILRNDPELVPDSPPADAPAQLPADLRRFVGRAAELRRLDAMLPRGTDPVRTVGVITVDGMAGVGKTATAVHFAHQVRDRFPDGQLFVDLGGQAPVPALRGVLHLLGVYGDRMPDDPGALGALYRTTLAGRRMIILLDNAASAAQVRQLLPGVPGSLVLVTSRRRLLGLDGAESVSVPLLSTMEGAELFVAMAGHDRAHAADPDLIDRLVALCGHLPLAITLAAARLRARPCWSLAHLVERLADQRLSELAAGDRSVAAAFSLSYAALDASQQRMFRVLGLHPGRDCDLVTAAKLAGVDQARAARLIDELLDTHLLDLRAPNRFTMHDLLQVYASGLAAEDQPRAAG